MTSLGNLRVKDIEREIISFGNLFYHRTAILERIRKIAFRNMIHRTIAEEHCRRVENNVSMECIQAKMLSDQGLENNKANRIIIGWATYYPLHLYLALLYAEIEFYEKVTKTSNIFIDNNLDSYLDANRQLVDSLGEFRDSFLHPSDTSTADELNFLQTGESYNIAPILQRKFDEYLFRLREKLWDCIFDKLNCLPESQKNYCFSRFLEKNMIRMKLNHDLEGVKRCVNGIESLIEGEKWVPDNLHEEKIADRIAECLDRLHPSRPETEFTQLTSPGEIQTAIQFPLIIIMLSGNQNPNHLGNGRYATQIMNHISFYRRLLITGMVLMNECLYDKENLINLCFLQQHPTPTEEVFYSFFDHIAENRKFSLQEMEEYGAPCRVIVALYYELLRIYNGVSRENPSITNSRLDNLISSGELKKLQLHRNSIFHVLDPQRNPMDVDLPSTTFFDVNYCENLLGGISDFWGVS